MNNINHLLTELYAKPLASVVVVRFCFVVPNVFRDCENHCHGALACPDAAEQCGRHPAVQPVHAEA